MTSIKRHILVLAWILAVPLVASCSTRQQADGRPVQSIGVYSESTATLWRLDFPPDGDVNPQPSRPPVVNLGKSCQRPMSNPTVPCPTDVDADEKCAEAWAPGCTAGGCICGMDADSGKWSVYAVCNCPEVSGGSGDGGGGDDNWPRTTVVIP